MEAVIVAAGRGMRMGAVGRTRPKCLFTVAGKTLLDHQLDALRSAETAGITVVTGHLHEKIALQATDCGIKLVKNEHYLTTGGAYSFLLGSESARSDLIYLVSDILYEADLVKRLGASANNITLAIQRRETMPDDMKVCLNGSDVAEISKGIHPSRAEGAFLGAAFIPQAQIIKLRSIISVILQDPRKRTYHFGDVIREGIANHGLNVKWMDMSDLNWCEIDSSRDLFRARRIWEEVSKDDRTDFGDNHGRSRRYWARNNR